jgi:hypothetical protein
MDNKDQYIISLFQQYLIECGVEHNPDLVIKENYYMEQQWSDLDTKKSMLFQIAYEEFIIDFEQDGGILPLPEYIQDEMFIASINILNDWQNNNPRFLENAKQYNVETA